MADESISVVFKPIPAIPGLRTYHETLVYTHSSGEEYFISMYASEGNPQGNPIWNVSKASSAAATGTTSPFGTLQVEQGAVADLPLRARAALLGPPEAPFDNKVVKTGSDLSGQWGIIVATENQIASRNLPYSPITLNSNSGASTALTAAGVPLPDTGFFSDHWAPASSNLLLTPMTPRLDNQTISSITDAAENSTVTITPNAVPCTDHLAFNTAHTTL